MANVEIIITATDKASGVLRGISNETGKLGGILGGVFKAGLAGAAVGVGALGVGLAMSVREAMGAEEALSQLTAVLKATKGAAGITSAEAQKLAGALQSTTRFSDEMIISGQAVLLQFRSIGKDVFPRATETALNLATALGTDVPSAARLLGKALETPGEGLLRLKAAGVAFTDSQEKQIKAMVAVGDAAGAQKLILDELEKSTGGAARAAGKTFAGQLDILKNQISDVMEEIGGAFLPMLKDLVEWVNRNIVPALKDFAEKVKFVIETIQRGDWGKLAETFWRWVETAINQAGRLLGNLVTAIKTWFAQNWETKIAPTLGAMAAKLVELLVSTAVALIGKLGEFLTAIGLWLQMPETQARLAVLGTTIGRAITNGLKDFFAAEGNWATARTALVNGVIDLIKGLPGAVVGVIWNTGAQMGRDLASAMAQAVRGAPMSPGEQMQNERMVLGNFPGTIAANFTNPGKMPEEARSLFGSVWGNAAEPRWWWENLSGAWAGQNWAWEEFLGAWRSKGFAAGGSFVVPSGFPNDTFPLRVSSGERVDVTPAGRGIAGSGSPVFVYAPMLSLADEREARDKLRPVLDAWWDDARRRRV